MAFKTNKKGEQYGKKLWSYEEDQMLRRAYEEIKDGQWNLISQKYQQIYFEKHGEVSLRSSKQCRERWFNKLHPDLQKTLEPWTQEQSLALLNIYEQVGPKWAKVIFLLCEAGFIRRSDNAIKNHFNVMVKNSIRDLNLFVQNYNRNLKQKTTINNNRKVYFYERTYSVEKLLKKRIQKNEFTSLSFFNQNQPQKQIQYSRQKQENVIPENINFHQSNQGTTQKIIIPTEICEDKNPSICKNENIIPSGKKVNQQNKNQPQQRFNSKFNAPKYLKAISLQSIRRFWLWSNDKSEGRLKIILSVDDVELKKVRSMFLEYIKNPENFSSEEVKELIQQVANFTKGCRKLTKNQKEHIYKQKHQKSKFHIQRNAKKIYDKLITQYPEHKKGLTKNKIRVRERLVFLIGRLYSKKEQLQEQINPACLLEKKEQAKIISSIIEEVSIIYQKQLEQKNLLKPQKPQKIAQKQNHPQDNCDEDKIFHKEKKTKRIRKVKNKQEKQTPIKKEMLQKQQVERKIPPNHQNSIELLEEVKHQENQIKQLKQMNEVCNLKINSEQTSKKESNSQIFVKIPLRRPFQEKHIQSEPSQYSLNSKKSIRPSRAFHKEQFKISQLPFIPIKQKGSFSQLKKFFPNSLIKEIQIGKELPTNLITTNYSPLEVESQKNIGTSNFTFCNFQNKNPFFSNAGIPDPLKIMSNSQDLLVKNSILKNGKSINLNNFERLIKSNYNSRQFLARSLQNLSQLKPVQNQIPSFLQSGQNLFNNSFFQNIRNVQQKNQNSLWKEPKASCFDQFQKDEFCFPQAKTNRGPIKFNPFNSQPLDFQIPQKLIETAKSPNFPIKNFNDYSMNYQHMNSLEYSKIFQFEKKFGFNSARLSQIDLRSDDRSKSHLQKQKSHESISNMFKSQRIPALNESCQFTKKSRQLSNSCIYSNNESKPPVSGNNLQNGRI